MSRRLPRSFFWVDQQLIRGGVWLKLHPHTRLAYIAIAASCDREGVSVWGRMKLMALAGNNDLNDWERRLFELQECKLIEALPTRSPPQIRLLSLEFEASSLNRICEASPKPFNVWTAPLVPTPKVSGAKTYDDTTAYRVAKIREIIRNLSMPKIL